MRIGRAEGLEAASFSQSDGVINFAAVAEGSDADLAVIIAQLDGHIGQTIPILTDDCDPLDTGIYKLESVLQVTTPGETETARFNVTISAGYSSPVIEVYYTASQRDATVHTGRSSPEGHVYIPASRLNQGGASVGQANHDLYGGGETTATIVIDEGTASLNYSIRPEDFYEGACGVEYFDNGQWSIATDKRVPDLPSSDRVRISNGFIRFTYQASGAGRLEVATATTWVTVAEFGMYYASTFAAANLFKPTSPPTVIRNDVNMVSLRFPLRYDLDTETLNREATVSLRRGHAAVSWTLESSESFLFASTTTEAASTATAGALTRATADSNGNRWIVGTPKAFTTDTTNGRISVTGSPPATPLFFGVSDPSPNTVASSWWMAIAETQAVSIR